MNRMMVLLMLLGPWVASASTVEPVRAIEATHNLPWSRGVSSEQQQAASALFLAGNDFLKKIDVVNASERYRQALDRWDHPAIHYNLVLTLALMGSDPLEVHQHLEAALRHGPEPFDQQKYEYARDYKRRLEAQLAWVEIACEKAGATVTLDGQTLFVGPGRHVGLVRPGPHIVMASQEGHETTSVRQEVRPGTRWRLGLQVYSEGELTRYRSPRPQWQPWAVMGAGVALAAGGGLLHLGVREEYWAYDSGILDCGGCYPVPGVAGRRIQGDNLQRMAVGAYVVGGATLVTGAVLLFLNRPQAYRIEPPVQSEEVVHVLPFFDGGSGGALATFRF